MFIVLSLLLGMLLGLVAGGGSMLAVPVFRYGLDKDPEVAFPGALLVVGIASVIGLALHAREGRVRWAEGSLFAVVSMVGAFAGGWVSGGFVPGNLHMILFAGALIWTGWKLIRMRGSLQRPETAEGDIDQRRLILTALGLGVFTGFLAIGGGVLVVGALAVLMRMPIKDAIPTSLLVIACNSFAGLAGHLKHVELPWADLLTVGALAAAGCYVGVKLNRRLPVKWVKDALGWLVMAAAIWVLVREVLIDS